MMAGLRGWNELTPSAIEKRWWAQSLGGTQSRATALPQQEQAAQVAWVSVNIRHAPL